MTTHTRSPFKILSCCLRGALGQPLASTDLPANPDEWEKVLRLSGTHLVTPQLRWALREQALFSELPADVAEYLDAVYILNLEKNQQCKDQLAHCVGVMNNAGVRPVLLKGAAVIAAGLYPTPGERMISDLDILIPSGSLTLILEKLTESGYEPYVEAGMELPNPIGFERQDHHYAPLVSKDWPVAIELHVHPVHLPFDKLLSSEEVFEEATRLCWRGKDCLLPSPTHLIVHNLIHSFIVDTQLAFHRLSIRQLLEFVLLSKFYCNQIDWQAVFNRLELHGYGRSLRQYVALANACLEFKIPKEVDISGISKFGISPYLVREDLDSKFIEWIINIFSQINWRMAKLRRNPERIHRLLKADFYSNFIKSIRY